ncbi:hypothetical protein SDC9_198855 [bioreactor metagenome]|uniref:Uncharacterized protein n=1 Tax=bioreactor metagenome TaxID=1076179 RepID=A0A645IVK3_9ZZZZ
MKRAHPVGMILLDPDSRDHRYGIGDRTAERHQVKEVVHKCGCVHQQYEYNGYAQQEEVWQDGLAFFIAVGKRFGQEVLPAHGVHQPDGGDPKAEQACADCKEHGGNTEDDRPCVPAQLLECGDDEKFHCDRTGSVNLQKILP